MLTSKMSLIKKYFFIRGRLQPLMFLRSNMRQYFFLSVFLYTSSLYFNSTDEQFISDVRGQYVNRFSYQVSSVLEQLCLTKALKPLADCFHVRLARYLRSIMPYEYVLKFFLITNDQVNAVFLSRYIVKKLEYHHRLKRLLNPLKEEFKYVGRVTRITLLKKLTEGVALDISMKNFKAV